MNRYMSLFCMAFAILVAAQAPATDSDNDTTGGADGGDNTGSPPHDAWVEIVLPKKLEVLEMLVGHMSSNYQRIRTWSGSYAERSKEVLLPSAIRNAASGLAAEADLAQQSEIRAEFDSVCRFSIDLSKNACFLALENGKEAYYETDTDTPATGLKRPLKQRCVLTTEHYLEQRPDARYHGFVELKGWQLPSTRVAFRDSPSKAEFSRFSSFVDPRELFYVAGRTKTWGEFELAYIPRLSGEYGDEVKESADRKLALSTAERDGVTWYRALFMGGSSATPLKEHIYASNVGFNLTRLTVWKGGSVSHRYQYGYRVVDGIHIPSNVVIEYSGLKKRRELQLQDCILNQPIAPSQFTYEALGIKDGDMIMDNIEQVAYEYKSGKPEKLANYGEGPPEDPADTEQADSPSRMIYVLLGLVVVIGVVVAFKMASKR